MSVTIHMSGDAGPMAFHWFLRGSKQFRRFGENLIKQGEMSKASLVVSWIA